jgi:hypothetical protein
MENQGEETFCRISFVKKEVRNAAEILMRERNSIPLIDENDKEDLENEIGLEDKCDGSAETI